MQPLTNRQIVDYLRLEEGEDNADLLLPTSPRYLGAFQSEGGLSHYWSYPTSEGVSWAELDANNTLGMTDDVPQAARDVTPPRVEHKTRKVVDSPLGGPVAARTKPARATWVPLSAMPRCNYHPAWYEHTSFDAAVKHYGATVNKDRSAGPGTRYFFIQLTSGRYACIESRGGFPQTVIISLEVDTRRAGKESGGKVHVRDIEEILLPMGGVFKMPAANLFIGWSIEKP